ncbi:hypothetical protein N657DRAFT_92420 [Parathielavia appendiculata]|uniref:Uncharacterized protein n=1 Tax=Parathielavia appendiculata TaxID=2587402 RepID=A0AAN6UBN3_9PEZI|nr:hypothetical protein N657DRAFT_92420 [Parathielavia appendiculata]
MFVNSTASLRTTSHSQRHRDLSQGCAPVEALWMFLASTTLIEVLWLGCLAGWSSRYG